VTVTAEIVNNPSAPTDPAAQEVINLPILNTNVQGRYSIDWVFAQPATTNATYILRFRQTDNPPSAVCTFACSPTTITFQHVQESFSCTSIDEQ
jgi:hypothetical protein